MSSRFCRSWQVPTFKVININAMELESTLPACVFYGQTQGVLLEQIIASNNRLSGPLPVSPGACFLGVPAQPLSHLRAWHHCEAFLFCVCECRKWILELETLRCGSSGWQM